VSAVLGCQRRGWAWAAHLSLCASHPQALAPSRPLVSAQRRPVVFAGEMRTRLGALGRPGRRGVRRSAPRFLARRRAGAATLAARGLGRAAGRL
jgi:hypothetical protein